VGGPGGTGEIGATPKGGACRLATSDLDGQRLRLFIGWSEAAERPVKSARVGIVGITFDEGVPDLRSCRVPDSVAELREFGIAALVAEPLADPDKPKRERATG